MNEKNKRTKKSVFACISCTLLLLLACGCFFSAQWYIKKFGQTGFDSILYTLLAETSGTDAAVIASFRKSAVLPAILVWMLLSVVFLQRKIGRPLSAVYDLSGKLR